MVDIEFIANNIVQDDCALSLEDIELLCNNSLAIPP